LLGGGHCYVMKRPKEGRDFYDYCRPLGLGLDVIEPKLALSERVGVAYCTPIILKLRIWTIYFSIPLNAN
jgi:hypothetical protein